MTIFAIYLCKPLQVASWQAATVDPMSSPLRTLHGASHLFPAENSGGGLHKDVALLRDMFFVLWCSLVSESHASKGHLRIWDLWDLTATFEWQCNAVRHRVGCKKKKNRISIKSLAWAPAATSTPSGGGGGEEEKFDICPLTDSWKQTSKEYSCNQNILPSPSPVRDCHICSINRALWYYRSDGRFWPVVLCCAVVRRKSASLRLVSMRIDTVLPY
jgi:hypothetical protein